MFIFYYIYFFGWKRSSVVQNMALIDPCCVSWDKLLMKGCGHHEDSIMLRSVKGCIYINSCRSLMIVRVFRYPVWKPTLVIEIDPELGN